MMTTKKLLDEYASTGDPVALTDALKLKFDRLPPHDPPGTLALPLPSWDHSLLAKLQFDADQMPLSSEQMTRIAGWLRTIAGMLEEGTEWKSYLLTLDRIVAPTSGPRQRRKGGA